MTTKKQVRLLTLGHKDHGKTTLTAAIVAYSAKQGLAKARKYDEIDVAPEERDQGIIIHSSHVPYETEKRAYGQIDCPSTADCLKTLIGGTEQMDAVILVLSAVDGVMPETHEHVLIARKVGAPTIIVYLNKCDLVDDEEMLTIQEDEVRDLLTKYGYPGDTTPIVRGSALQALDGEASEYGAQSIQKLLATLDDDVPDPRPDVDCPFLMPIENVLSIPGGGVVVTGKVEAGKVKVGAEVEIVGLGDTRKTVVTGTEMLHKPVEEAVAGFNAAISLQGIAKEEIERGMVLAEPSSAKPHRKFRAVIYVAKMEEGGRPTPVTNGYKPQFFLRTTDVSGELVSLFDIDNDKTLEMIMPGDIAHAQVQLLNSVALSNGLKFAIREGGRTIGCGVVSEILE